MFSFNWFTLFLLARRSNLRSRFKAERSRRQEAERLNIDLAYKNSDLETANENLSAELRQLKTELEIKDGRLLVNSEHISDLTLLLEAERSHTREMIATNGLKIRQAENWHGGQDDPNS